MVARVLPAQQKVGRVCLGLGRALGNGSCGFNRFQRVSSWYPGILNPFHQRRLNTGSVALKRKNPPIGSKYPFFIKKTLNTRIM